MLNLNMVNKFLDEGESYLAELFDRQNLVFTKTLKC